LHVPLPAGQRKTVKGSMTVGKAILVTYLIIPEVLLTCTAI
jgi:hypothetical protein